jgi:hypothetical protein
MIRCFYLLILVAALFVPRSGWSATGPAVGPFFESAQPFFHSQVEVFAPTQGKTTGENMVVRGIVLPLSPCRSLAIMAKAHIVRCNITRDFISHMQNNSG